MFFQKKYEDIPLDPKNKWISGGPCQTPALAFCEARHEEICNFKPETYWLIQVEVEIPAGGEAQNLKFEHDEKFNDWDRANRFRGIIDVSEN